MKMAPCTKLGIAAIGVALLVAASVPARAAPKPAKPKAITIVVPFSHGGPTDRLADSLAQALARTLKQKVVTRNAPGAGGTIAAEQLAKARPDGNTLLLSNIGQATSVAFYRRLRYDTVADFEPIGLVADVPMTLLGKPRLAAGKVTEFTAELKGRGGKLALGHAGVGSASHLCGLLVRNALHIDFASVAYNGTAEALADLEAGRIDLLCDQVSNTLAPIKAGTVKVFGVTTASRFAGLPEVPTLAEGGLAGFDLVVWHGLYAPKGTPASAVKKLAGALSQALQDARLQAEFAQRGASPAAPDRATPDALRAHLKAEVDKWSPIIRKAAVHAD